MGEFVFVAMVDQPTEIEFRRWPRHITLLPPFDLEQLQTEIVAERVSKLIVPFAVEVGETKMFGKAREIPVRVIKPSDDLNTLHQSLLVHVEHEGGVVKNREFIGSNYQPHITIKHHRRTPLIERINVDAITLVERHPAKRRTIVSNFELSGIRRAQATSR